jgi:hypothetical protein
METIKIKIVAKVAALNITKKGRKMTLEGVGITDGTVEDISELCKSGDQVKICIEQEKKLFNEPQEEQPPVDDKTKKGRKKKGGKEAAAGEGE